MGVRTERNDRILLLELVDPDRRNALGVAMFDQLETVLAEAADDESLCVLVLAGRGKAFCAGFDLTVAVERPEVLGSFIERLSGVCRTLRRMHAVVIASVQGAALAGGCAIVSACDIVIAGPGARFGYPVHRIGISPAVSAPTLVNACGFGAARRLQLGGEIVDAETARRLGLVHRLTSSESDLAEQTRTLARQIAGHGPVALRATKAWLNELDGSLEDRRFDAVTRDTADEAVRPDSVELLRAVWSRR